jgi:hypothetical protein
MTAVLDRLGSKFTVGDDCWEWTGARTPAGYGVFWTGQKVNYAHRVLYELLVEPIPEGLHIDHLCRVRHCVRPSHLEPVTIAENNRRTGNAVKTHCLNGHEFTPENTYEPPKRPGQRYCRTCAAEREKKRVR